MSQEPFVPNSFEIWPDVFDKILECFLLLDKATIFLHKVEIFEQVWKGIDNPVNIGEIPPSGLGGSYYWRTTEGRMSSWQDGHPMTTTWVKKGIHHSKIYESCWKAESSSPLAIYKPHPEKIWASAWDFQQCGMCDQHNLRSACAYAQSDQSLC